MSDTVETIELTTADMIEIVASGGNGAEYVDVPSLLGQAAQELRALRAENERLKENLMDAQGEIHYLKNRAEF